MALLITILMLTVLGGFIIFKIRSNADPSWSSADTSRRVDASTSAFHAVSINMDASPCPAIREYEGRRLLSNEAPMLPLPDCDQRHCNCRFEHYKDRRTGKNRRDDVVTIARISSGESIQERRSWRDRRASRAN
jgi:hypothetical protein